MESAKEREENAESASETGSTNTPVVENGVLECGEAAPRTPNQQFYQPKMIQVNSNASPELASDPELLSDCDDTEPEVQNRFWRQYQHQEESRHRRVVTNHIRNDGYQDENDEVQYEEYDIMEEERDDVYNSDGEGVEYYPAQPKVRSKISIAVILVGNLATVVALGLLYLNYVLFKSYFFVLLYSFLISEALWDTKISIVRFIRRINDENQMSPRGHLNRIWNFPARELLYDKIGVDMSWKKLTTVFTVVLTVGILMVAAPFMVLLGCAVIALLTMLAVLFDRRLLIFFRLHRWFMTDDSLVALMVITVLLSVGVITAATFVLLTIRDAMTAVEVVSVSVSKILDDEATQELWKHATTTGTKTLKSMVDNFEGQYRGTAWAPIVDRISEAVQHVETDHHQTLWTLLHHDWSEGAAIEWDGSVQGGWAILQTAVQNALPEWDGNQTFVDFAQAVYADPSEFVNENILQFTGKLDGVLTGTYVAVLNSSAVIFSLLLSVFDFGVRIAFLLTLVFMLLSSKENVLHAFLKEFVDDTEDHLPASVSPQTPLYITPSAVAGHRTQFQAKGGALGVQQLDDHPVMARKSSSADSIETNDSLYDDANMQRAPVRLSSISSSQGGAYDPELVSSDDGVARKHSSPILQFERKLRRTIEGVFMLPFKMAVAHAFVTMTLFYLYNADFMFFASSLSVFFTLFPVLYPQWISIPWCAIYMYQGYIGSAVVFQVLHYMIMSYCDEHLLMNFQLKRLKGDDDADLSNVRVPVHPMYQERRSSSSSISSSHSSNSSTRSDTNGTENSPGSVSRMQSFENDIQRVPSGNSTPPLYSRYDARVKQELAAGKKRNSKTNYLTGLSLFFGVNAFGAQGVLLGPLLVCLAIVAYESFLSHFKREQQQHNWEHQLQMQQQQLKQQRSQGFRTTSPQTTFYPNSELNSPKLHSKIASMRMQQYRKPANFRSASDSLHTGSVHSRHFRQNDDRYRGLSGNHEFSLPPMQRSVSEVHPRHAAHSGGGGRAENPDGPRPIAASPVAVPRDGQSSSAPSPSSSVSTPTEVSPGFPSRESRPGRAMKGRAGSSPVLGKKKARPSGRQQRHSVGSQGTMGKRNFGRMLRDFVEPFLGSDTPPAGPRVQSPRSMNYYGGMRRGREQYTNRMSDRRATSTRHSSNTEHLESEDRMGQNLRRRRPQTTRGTSTVSQQRDWD